MPKASFRKYFLFLLGNCLTKASLWFLLTEIDFWCKFSSSCLDDFETGIAHILQKLKKEAHVGVLFNPLEKSNAEVVWVFLKFGTSLKKEKPNCFRH